MTTSTALNLMEAAHTSRNNMGINRITFAHIKHGGYYS